GISPADDDAVDAGDGADGERHPAKQPAAIVHARRLTKQHRRRSLCRRLLDPPTTIDASSTASGTGVPARQPWQILSCTTPARHRPTGNLANLARHDEARGHARGET